MFDVPGTFKLTKNEKLVAYVAQTVGGKLTQQAVDAVEAQLDAEKLRGVEPVELRLRSGLHAPPRA